MIVSRYKLRQRTRIIKRGISDFKERLARLEDFGGKPHRSAEETLLERCTKKLLEKSTWYRGWDRIRKKATNDRLQAEAAPASKEPQSSQGKEVWVGPATLR